MFSTSDTIVAIATPPGRGGIGVVRISGPDARQIAKHLVAHRPELEPRRATFTRVERGEREGQREAIDQVVATYFPTPHSYTGDDVVELSAHGSPVVLRAIVGGAIEWGARLAEPGEFTLRAFLNGRIDLLQAEAVADLVDAVTPLQARAAFDQLEGTLTKVIGDIDAALFELIARLEASVDFPDEGFHFVERDEIVNALDELLARTSALVSAAGRGRLIREGLQVAIVGKPNVGKSSLFNALAGASRAIVTDVPGTTRDLVTETVDLDGLRVTLVDTAGLRPSSDPIEAEGIARSRQAVDVADLVLVVVDDDRDVSGNPGIGEISRPGDHNADNDSDVYSSQTIDKKRLIVRNKIDLNASASSASAGGVPPQLQARSRSETVCVSAKTGAGLDCLRRAIATAFELDIRRDRPEITNMRHAGLVQRAHQAMVRARQAAHADGGALSEEFVLADLQDAREALEEITGRRAPEDVLAHIFSRFCIGK